MKISLSGNMKISNRDIHNSADKIIASAECSFREKQSLFYLKSAVRKATIRKRKQIINNIDNDERMKRMTMRMMAPRNIYII
jgi:hypothetical protein